MSVKYRVLKDKPNNKKVELEKRTPSVTARHIEEHTPNREVVTNEEVKVSYIVHGFLKQANNISSLLNSKIPLNNIPGGRAHGMAPADFPNKKLLARGVKVEREHTPDNTKALEITMDHTKEFPDYYSKDKGLPAMERKLEKKASLTNLYLQRYAF